MRDIYTLYIFSITPPPQLWLHLHVEVPKPVIKPTHSSDHSHSSDHAGSLSAPPPRKFNFSTFYILKVNVKDTFGFPFTSLVHQKPPITPVFAAINTPKT